MKRTVTEDRSWELTKEEVSRAILEYVSNHDGDPEAIVGTSTIVIHQGEDPNRTITGASVTVRGASTTRKIQ